MALSVSVPHDFPSRSRLISVFVTETSHFLWTLRRARAIPFLVTLFGDDRITVEDAHRCATSVPPLFLLHCILPHTNTACNETKDKLIQTRKGFAGAGDRTRDKWDGKAIPYSVGQRGTPLAEWDMGGSPIRRVSAPHDHVEPATILWKWMESCYQLIRERQLQS